MTEQNSPAVNAAKPSVWTARDASSLLQAVVDWSAEVPDDAFVADALVVPGPGHQRWVSQGIAGARGICSGIDLLTLGSLRRLLRRQVFGADADLDPWRPDALALVISGALTELPSAAWAEPLRGHLEPAIPEDADPRLAERPGRLHATGRRIARLFHRYTALAPQMVDAWEAGQRVDPWGQPLAASAQWQYELWRAARTALGDQHPLARHRALVAALPELDLDWPRLGVLDVGGLDWRDRELVRTLAVRTDTTVWRLDQVADAAEAPLGRLSRQIRLHRDAWPEAEALECARPDTDTLLRRLQAGIGAGALTRGPLDGTVRLHGSHGPSRQVEVLRDALCGLMQDDPTLEPRDIVVVCPDVDTYAPLLQATFGPREAEDVHPGHRLRLQVPNSTTGGGVVLQTLAEVVRLVRGRGRASELVAFCSSAPVARRFGFSPDDLLRLRRLVQRSAMRWGVDDTIRKGWGVDGVPQGTWLNGLRRLVAGALVADEPLTTLGLTAPVANEEAQDLRVIGLLAEVVTKLRQTTWLFREPATVTDWGVRLTDCVDWFVELPVRERWMTSAALGAIQRWVASAEHSSALLDAAAIQTVLDDLQTSQPRRPAFGNGSLQVVGLDELRGVPHRVVAVLGLDDGTFPRRSPHLGDDLVALRPRETDPGPTDALVAETDPRSRSQAALVDALLSARDHLLVTYQAFDHRTNERLELPVTVRELVTCLAQIADEPITSERGTDVAPLHPLQPHDSRNFLDERPFSFDRAGLAGARTLMARQESRESSVSAAPVLGLDWRLPAHEESTVALGDLTDFFSHPARALLRRGLGASLQTHSDTIDDSIPTELWGLSEYKVGDAMLQRVLAGASLETAKQAAWLEGEVPPGVNGEVLLDDVVRRVSRLSRQISEVRGEEVDLAVATELVTNALTGVVRVRGREVLDAAFGRLNGAALLRTWLQLLAVAAAHPNQWRATIIRQEGTFHLEAPSSSQARVLLEEFLAWRRLGLESVLLAPPRSLFSKATISGAWTHTKPPSAKQVEGAWRNERDADWEVFAPKDFAALLASRVHRCLDLTVREFDAKIYGPINGSVR